MKKILLIGRKDLTLAFRDRAALLLMLAAPFALTLGLGFITGRLSGGSSSGLADIPVIVVNQDGEQLGDALINLFGSEDLASLIALSETADPAAARRAGGRGCSRRGDHHPRRLHPEHHPGRGRDPDRRSRAHRALHQPDAADQRGRGQDHPGRVHEPGGGRPRGRPGGSDAVDRARTHPAPRRCCDRGRAGRAPGGRGGEARRSS